MKELTEDTVTLHTLRRFFNNFGDPNHPQDVYLIGITPYLIERPLLDRIFNRHNEVDLWFYQIFEMTDWKTTSTAISGKPSLLKDDIFNNILTQPEIQCFANDLLENRHRDSHLLVFEDGVIFNDWIVHGKENGAMTREPEL